jgi:aspartyl protease family protein
MNANLLILLVLAAIIGVFVYLVSLAGGSVGGMDDDDFVRFVFLGTLALVIGATTLFAARVRPGRALIQAGIWCLVFLVLIAAYTFADDFRGAGQRIRAALLPGSAIVTDAGEVMVMRGRDNHFSLDAELNGEWIPMLVDTGASIVAIDPETAAAIGIDTSALRYQTRIMTANGVADAAPVRIDTLRVGDIERRNVEAVVTQDGGPGFALLGMSFLGTLSSVDFRGDRLVLRD